MPLVRPGSAALRDQTLTKGSQLVTPFVPVEIDKLYQQIQTMIGSAGEKDDPEDQITKFKDVFCDEGQ
jgi:hypothetical protein